MLAQTAHSHDELSLTASKFASNPLFRRRGHLGRLEVFGEPMSATWGFTALHDFHKLRGTQRARDWSHPEVFSVPRRHCTIARRIPQKCSEKMGDSHAPCMPQSGGHQGFAPASEHKSWPDRWPPISCNAPTSVQPPNHSHLSRPYLPCARWARWVGVQHGAFMKSDTSHASDICHGQNRAQRVHRGREMGGVRRSTSHKVFLKRKSAIRIRACLFKRSCATHAAFGYS